MQEAIAPAVRGRVDASTPLRWGAPDLATPVRAVAKSEADAVPGTGNDWVCIQDRGPALKRRPIRDGAGVPRGFQKASIAPIRWHARSNGFGQNPSSWRQLRQWSQPGSNRRPPACKADQFVHSCLVVSRKCPANAAFLLATGGHERTARDKLVPPWCPLSVRDLGRREEGSPRLARLRQLEDAAAAKAALASAIAVCASSRGISSNSSITWPYVLRVSRASWPSWRAT